MLVLLLYLRLQKLRPQYIDKYLVKMEKVLNLWVENMNRKRALIGGSVLHQRASDTKPFIASKRWLHRFRDRFRLKNIKITRERETPQLPNFYYSIIVLF